MQWQCPSPSYLKNGEVDNGQYCTNCGEGGHIGEYCPKLRMMSTKVTLGGGVDDVRVDDRWGDDVSSTSPCTVDTRF